MTNEKLRELLNKYLVFSPLHDLKDLKGTDAFYFDGKLSIRGLKINEMVRFSDLFLTSNLNINDVKGIEFIGCHFEKDVFIECEIDSILIKGCRFESKMYINKQTIHNNKKKSLKKFAIVNSLCKGNFKLHNCIIESFIAKDTDFLSNADFFKSTLVSGGNVPYEEASTDNNIINFNALNFEGLALFGEVEFKSLVSFKYVTFKDYVHFRGATFNEGVDLDYANIGKEINFYNLKGIDSLKSKSKTSQETFRIIKHQFKIVGNVIDSNKYHSLELEKKKSSLRKYSPDYIALILHELSSNYAQSWVRPIFGIVITGFITYFLLCFTGQCDCKLSNQWFIDVFRYFSIFNDEQCFKDSPIIFFFNKILLGYLYYQFITAVRKNTKT